MGEMREFEQKWRQWNRRNSGWWMHLGMYGSSSVQYLHASHIAYHDVHDVPHYHMRMPTELDAIVVESMSDVPEKSLGFLMYLHYSTKYIRIILLTRRKLYIFFISFIFFFHFMSFHKVFRETPGKKKNKKKIKNINDYLF